MKSDNILAAKRIKQVRQALELTQKEFAQKLNVINNIADIERSKTKIPGYFIAQLMQVYHINPLWVFGFSSIKHLNNLPVNVSPKIITLNAAGKENIALVSAKAAAGYPSNMEHIHWHKELPQFNIPLPQFKNATFRGFQVQGESMLPTIKPNEWVIAKAVDDLNSLSNKRICIVVLKDSLLIKQLHKTKTGIVKLISLNKLYPVIEIQTTEIKEIWEVKSKISFDINTVDDTPSIQELELAINSLKNQLSKINFT